MSNLVPLSVSSARARLQHLLALPESPMRRREISALERMLELGMIGATPKKRRTSSAGRQPRELTEAVLDEDDEPPVPPPTPRREVQHVEGHRRVIIRPAKKFDENDEVEDAASIRERERRRGDIQSLVGLRHRGDD